MMIPKSLVRAKPSSWIRSLKANQKVMKMRQCVKNTFKKGQTFIIYMMSHCLMNGFAKCSCQFMSLGHNHTPVRI